MAGYAGAWQHSGSMAAPMTESRPASTAPDLEGACLSDWTERMRMGHWARCRNAQIGLFSHVRVYYGAGFIRRTVDVELQ